MLVKPLLSETKGNLSFFPPAFCIHPSPRFSSNIKERFVYTTLLPSTHQIHPPEPAAGGGPGSWGCAETAEAQRCHRAGNDEDLELDQKKNHSCHTSSLGTVCCLHLTISSAICEPQEAIRPAALLEVALTQHANTCAPLFYSLFFFP